MSEPKIILYRKHFDALPLELLELQNLFSSIVYPLSHSKDQLVKELLLKNENCGKIIFQLSKGHGLESNIEQIRQASEKTLLAEIDFGKSINKQKISTFFYQLLPEKYTNLPRILYSKAKENLFLLGTKMTDWHLWNSVRAQADYSSSIRLALEMTAEIPEQIEIRRWLGEPIHSLIIPTELFSFNVAAGYEELSAEHEKLLDRFVKKGVTSVILKVTSKNPPKLEDCYDSLVYYVKQGIYTGTVCRYQHDTLLIPLQPLFQNLSNRTYELFEKDPAKYDLYQKAIQSALIDLIPENHESPAVLMIVGAGRGPLVRACINAGVVTKRKVKIFIVEKNPSAISE